MFRLAALAVVLGGLAAAFCLVPLRGRTALARFQAAPDAGTFLSSAWDEWRSPRAAPPRRPKPTPKPAKPHAKREPLARAEQPAVNRAPARRVEPAAPRATPPPPPPAHAPPAAHGAPAEELSANDRAALDRLLSDRSR